MDKPKSLLNDVSSFLLKRGEEFEWITMPGDPGDRIGLAYVQFDTSLPCSFMFTEVQKPLTLVLDVLFASRIASQDYAEVGLLLQSLNANQPHGSFMLDMEAGYVYFRQTLVVEGLELSGEQVANAVRNMEATGVDMANTYADIISREFSV